MAERGQRFRAQENFLGLCLEVVSQSRRNNMQHTEGSVEGSPQSPAVAHTAAGRRDQPATGAWRGAGDAQRT